MQRGVFYVFSAFFLWGLFPLYFHALRHVDPVEILGHRIVWCLLCLVLVLAVRHQFRWIGAVLKNPRTLLVFTGTSLLICANWGVYVYAITSGQTLEASLGYFINPLVSVVIGALILKERLRLAQKAAFGVAAMGVAWIALTTGATPWLGLCLAVSFAFYGLLRKIAPLGSLEGLSLETAMMLPLALAYLGYLWSTNDLGFANADATTRWLLLAAGPITAVPLLLFNAGVRLISLSTTGIIQYLSPTMVFLIGLFCFDEPFSSDRFIGFVFIWFAVALFAIESFVHARRAR
jgi:chloramphenicol-sensitive protein RarD